MGRRTHAASSPLALPMAQLGPAVAWLRARDVPATRIAHVFGLTPEHVRQLDRRTRQANPRVPWGPPHLSATPTPAVRLALGVRPEPDDAQPSRTQQRRADDVEVMLERIRRECATSYEFLDGVRQCRAMRPVFGYSGNTLSLRLLATRHQYLAWFAVHSGRTRTAWRHASLSLHVSNEAHKQAHDRSDFMPMMASVLIGSHACLLSQHPDAALSWLEAYEDLATVSGSALGSEYFRQRGAAAFQQGTADAATRRWFTRSAAAMEERAEAMRPEDILMTGVRHTALLDPVDIDDALGLRERIRNAFGPESLEASMTTHWAAACAFSTDSPSAHDHALEALATNGPTATRFGHQATIAYLLSQTPHLQLPDRLRTIWVRSALYFNAYANR